MNEKKRKQKDKRNIKMAEYRKRRKQREKNE